MNNLEVNQSRLESYEQQYPYFNIEKYLNDTILTLNGKRKEEVDCKYYYWHRRQAYQARHTCTDRVGFRNHLLC